METALITAPSRVTRRILEEDDGSRDEAGGFEGFDILSDKEKGLSTVKIYSRAVADDAVINFV